jgi:hypothetical protein
MLGVNGLRSAVGGGIEIDAVDDPLQRRVFLGDGPHVGGHALADLVGELADDRPDRLLGIGRLQRQEDADEIVLRFTHDLRDAFGFMRSAVARGSVIALGELERLFPRPDLGGDAVQLVIEDIAEALGEDEREDKSLYFGASFAPRMEQAASQIHCSRDLFFSGLGAVDLRVGIRCLDPNCGRRDGEEIQPTFSGPEEMARGDR